MKIATSRFGELDIDEAKVITFTEGILGFQQHRTYVLLDHDKNTPFRWLQSTQSPDLAFVLIDPLHIIPDYRAEVKKEDVEDLKLTSLEKAVLLCIVTIGKECSSVTANLVGPIVINPDTMLARQVILVNSTYSIQHDLAGGEQKKTTAAAP